MTADTAPDDREHRHEVHGTTECPHCGKKVELVAETEEWVEADDGSGRWLHSAFGPAMGICCGYLIVDSFEGCQVFRLPSATTPTDEPQRA